MSSLISSRRKDIVILILLTVLSGVLHFWRLSIPPTVVFDEAHFTTYASHYASRTGFYDIHPPLGKLLYAGTARAFGVTKPYEFIRFWRDEKGEFQMESDGGKPYGDFPYLALRGLSAVVGTLLIPLAYLLARLLALSPLSAGLAGFFLALDNGMLLQTRLILLDGFTLFFGLSGFVFFLLKDWLPAHNSKRKWLAVVSALLFGLAGSVKLTGFGFMLGALLAAWLYGIKKSGGENTPVRPRITLEPIGLTKFVALTLVPFFALFVIHRFVVPVDRELAYWHILLNNEGARAAQMLFSSLKALPFGWLLTNSMGYIGDVFLTVGGNLAQGDHPSRSFFFTWPVNYKAVVYWYTASHDTFIYFLGNVVLWPISALAVLWTLLRWLKTRTVPDSTTLFLLAGYAANFLPFAFFVINGRPTYTYHYIAALVFAVMLFAKELPAFTQGFGKRTGAVLFGSTVAAIILGFVVVSPLTYGLPSAEWIRVLSDAVLETAPVPLQ